MRLGILASHPIQYQAPWFRALAKEADLQVFFAHNPDARQQGEGFGAAFRWDVDLLSGYNHRFLENIARRPGTSFFAGCDTPQIAKLIRGGNFDAFIVSGWHLKCYWQAVRACRRAGVPVLVRGDSQLGTPRSALKRFGKEIVYRSLLRRFNGFLVVGQRNREYLQHYGVPYERMFSVPHFVDNEWFRAGAEMARKQKAEIRKEWGATNGTLIALFAGKFTPKKRPGDLLESLARLRLGGQHAIAVFVGAGELEPNLRQNAARLRVVARFEGFRNQTELPARYASADTLVLPSDGGETWGLVVNEAMACGLPAIVSQAVGCAPDLIEEGRTGFTFPLGDVSALAGRLSQMHNLRREGWDFASHLRRKLAAYTVEAAAQGTLRAAQQSAARLVQFSQNKLSS